MSLAFASQHTTNFGPLLHQLGASVLVSTYQAGQLIILRASMPDNTLNTHFCPLERPMGMALQADKLAIGSAFQVVEYRNMAAVAPKVAPVNRHDGCYLPRYVHVTGAIDIHEMEYDRKGKLWLVNTKMSCLCTLDQAYSIVPYWRPPFVSAYDLTDRCHLNGLALRHGEPAFATALGETDTAGGWRVNKASGGLLMSVPKGKIVARGLSMPHSPRWYQDKLWYLESGAGRLCTVDPKTGQQDVIIELPGFTRGLTFAGQLAFIGLSQVRETAVFAGLPLTTRVSERHCGVWVVDINARQIVAYIFFTGDVQEIFAITLLPHRFPALLELSDPLLRNSYALPEHALSQVAAVPEEQTLFEQAQLSQQQGELELALERYEHLLKRYPDHTDAHFQLGTLLSQMDRWPEAIEQLQKVIQQQPNHAQAYNNLGTCYARLGEPEQALIQFDQALSIDQRYADAHFNRGLMYLLQGNYARGWEDFEWRLQQAHATRLNCPQPRWQGEDISNKTLLIYNEQGHDDALQFARFLPEIAKRCQKLMVLCSEDLRPIFNALPAVDEVRLPQQLNQIQFDYYCPIMSLAKVLDITLDNLPTPTAYLKVPERTQVPLLTSNKFKVGLVWQSTNHHHSCPLTDLIQLASLQDVECYSLQNPLSVEDGELLTRHGIHNLESELTDYGRTAALIKQLDLVISVCTSVAHLSAGLGQPTWVLLAYQSDWHWLEQRSDSPWYPTVRLFRQFQPGDWQNLVQRVRAALDSVVAQQT